MLSYQHLKKICMVHNKLWQNDTNLQSWGMTAHTQPTLCPHKALPPELIVVVYPHWNIVKWENLADGGGKCACI